MKEFLAIVSCLSLSTIIPASAAFLVVFFIYSQLNKNKCLNQKIDQATKPSL